VRIGGVGECLAELTEHGPAEFRLAFAGDVFNTAVYLRRALPADVGVCFVTAVGDDWLSERLLAAVADEGIEPVVQRVAGASPALYLVQTAADGERSFTYYRSASPVRTLFGPDGDSALVEQVAGLDVVYYSAITLQLLADGARARLFAAVDRARGRGATVAFDTNLRVAGWPDLDAAAAAIRAAAGRADVLLTSMDDERRLDPAATPETVVAAHRGHGVPEVVVKDGAGAVTVATASGCASFATTADPDPLDTTGAGDAFAAGYLATRLTGGTVADGVRAGQRIAAVVIRHHGAIVPRP
jgi:2-dehydro-3-deoxygluconokinase